MKKSRKVYTKNMIKKGKSRIIITLPDTQIEWLQKTCKRAGLTLSKYISWLMAKKIEEIYLILKYNENKPSDEEINQILEIARAKWINN